MNTKTVIDYVCELSDCFGLGSHAFIFQFCLFMFIVTVSNCATSTVLIDRVILLKNVGLLLLVSCSNAIG